MEFAIRTALLLIVSLPLAAQPPARIAPPETAALQAARSTASDAILDLLVDAHGAEKATRVLMERSRSEKSDPASAYLLLGYALKCAGRLQNLALVQAVVDAFAERFEIDDHAMLEAELGKLVEKDVASPLAFTYAYLDLAGRGWNSAQDTEERAAAAIAKATEHATKLTDPTLLAFLRSAASELAAKRAAWLRCAKTGAGSADRGRFLCFMAGDWQSGLPLFVPQNAVERRILENKIARQEDARTCMTIADSWLAEAKAYESESAAAVRLARRNIYTHAWQWYGRAWLLGDGIERERVVRSMGRLEGRILDTPRPGVIRIGQDGLAQVLTKGCQPRIENGMLILGSDGRREARATCRYAFRRIRSVTIRGGIRSQAGLNFRFQVGPLNALCNWEVKPENQFYVGDRRFVSTPPLLRAGKEHEFHIRQIGDEVVFFCDGKVAFRTHAALHGTVCVYPAVGSEIFVREILIDGDVDPHTVVTEPIGKTW